MPAAGPPYDDVLQWYKNKYLPQVVGTYCFYAFAALAMPTTFVLVRESPKAVGTALRFGSRPCCASDGESARLLVDRWRDTHNRKLSAEALRREGKVCCAPLSEDLAAEYLSFRSQQTAWQPLRPPVGLRRRDRERLPPVGPFRRRVPHARAPQLGNRGLQKQGSGPWFL